MKLLQYLLVATIGLVFSNTAYADGFGRWQGLHQTGFETHYFQECSSAQRWAFRAMGEAGVLLGEFYGRYSDEVDVEDSTLPEPPSTYADTPFIYLDVSGELQTRDPEKRFSIYDKTLFARKIHVIRQATQEDIDNCLD